MAVPTIALDRRVFITGGASGIGLGTAMMLTDAGASVVIADIDPDALARACAQEPSLHAVRVDVRDRASVQTAIAEAHDVLGGLDTLVNCAGIFTFRPFLEITDDEWDRILDVNLRGTFLTCQIAMPLLVASGRGRIVNVASDAGKRAEPLLAHYSASKFGVVGLTQSLAQEFGSEQVTVNAVCPCSTPDTGMGQLVLDQKVQMRGQTRNEVLTSGARSYPLGRLCTVDDVASTICFLISDGGGFISGESINLDGGALTP